MATAHQQPRQFAVVTGASSGIGRELAKQFAQNGFNLLITAEDHAGLAEAAAELQRLAPAAQVQTVVADLAESRDVDRLYGAIRRLGRPVDALAANAGIGAGGHFATDISLGHELRLIHLNVTSQVHLIRLMAPDMIRRRAGRILVTSSIAALMPGPFEAVYAASKAFLRSFGQAIRNELADQGVSVTVLMPGPTETEFFHRAGMDDTKVGQASKDDPADVAEAGFQALMAGKDHVVAGAMNKLQAAATTVLPDTTRASLHRQQAKPQH